MLAGTSGQVTRALHALTTAAAAAGLTLEPTKSEVVVTSPDSSANLRGIPAGFIRRHGEFTLLGAAIGGPGFCCRHTSVERVTKAAKVMDAVASLPDAQTALLLLRHCCSYSKLAYTMRVTPPSLHEQALGDFDDKLRECLGQVGGMPLSQRVWRQATLKVGAGGLGLRSAKLHAPAAFIASVTCSVSLCRALDANYQEELSQSVSQFNSSVAPSEALPATPAPVKQQQLSAALDAATLTALVAEADCEADRAHLRLLQQPGAGSWLLARPAEVLGLALDSQIFRTLLRLRLRVPIASTEGYCPLCDGVADVYGDHARACACGGDRTKRHNRLRSVLAARAASAGLSPEVEKQELLPARPTETGACEAGAAAATQSRRPADVWVPSWGAFDLAVTSGLRSGMVSVSARDGSRAATDYEARKRSHQQTAMQCTAAGLQFVPLVAEACAGGWAPEAMRTWKALGSLIAAQTGEATGLVVDQLLQTLSVTLQRENARAVLRRLPKPAAAPSPFAAP